MLTSTTGLRETVVRYKDPGQNVLKNWNSLINSPKISAAIWITSIWF